MARDDTSWIEKGLEKPGKSKTGLAKALGRAPSMVTSLLKGGRTLKAFEVEIIADYLGVTPPPYPGVLRRFKTGEEFEPDPEFSPDGDQSFASGQAFEATMPGGRPEIDVRPGAGHGQDGQRVAHAIDSGGAVTGHLVVAEWVMPEAFYRHELHANPDGTLFMQVIGNSMVPTLWPGDRVIVDTRQNTFGPDAIYVFDDGDGEPRVKSLKKILGTGEVRVVSDNRETYGEDVMSLASIRIIGRVVGKVSKL